VPWLREVVYHDLDTDQLEDFLNKFDVERVALVAVLGLLIREHEAKSHLIALVHYRPVAWNHLPGVKMQYAGDRFEIFGASGEKLVSARWFGGIGPKNDDVRKHGETIPSRAFR
jgi:hypothetical protein